MTLIGRYILFVFSFLAPAAYLAQGGPSSSAPYCNGAYTSGNCLQGGPTNSPNNPVNDFIDIFKTSGGGTNINNSNSGCNGGPNNYANHCQHYLQVIPGQVITCTLQSGITFAQGFAIWVDWNQDNTFQNPGEQVAATTNVPPPATPTVLTFTIPLNQPNGAYRLRVRCAFATVGTAITPCGTFGFGETEDYTIYVGPVPLGTGIPTGTATILQPTICVGQQLNFSVTTSYTGALSYTWTGPSSYSATGINPALANASLTSAGVYSVLISNTVCPVTRTVQAYVVGYPAITTAPNSHTICQGGNFIANVNVPGPLSGFSYLWQGPGQVSSPIAPNSLVTPPLQPAAITQTTLLYSVIVTPTLWTCPSTASLTVLINNPLTPTLFLPTSICNINSAMQLQAVPIGGTWTATGVTPNGVLTPSLALVGTTNTIQYSVSIGNCVASNTGSIEISRFHPANLTSAIPTRCSLDPPFYLMNVVQDTTTGSWSGQFGVGANNLFFSSNLATGVYTVSYLSPSFPNPTTCPASTITTVQVFAPATPTILPIQPICSNGSTVQLQALPGNGVWSANSGVSFGGVLNPGNCGIGPNSVVYSAGQGTCVASNSRTFEVSRFNPATLTGNLPSFCANGSAFNLFTIVQYTGGVWTGISVNNGAFNPSGLPTNTYGLVYNTQSTPNVTLCPDSSRVNAFVLNPPTPVIQTVGPFCQKNGHVQLSVSPSNGQWTTAPYLTANGVFVPSLATVGSNFVQYSIGTNTCKAQSSILVSVEAFVPATIAGTIADLCDNGNFVNLLPLAGNGGNWSGVGVTAGIFYPTASGAGVFKVFHSTSSVPSGLCPDVDSLAVKVYSLAPPAISQVGPFCNNSLPIKLQVSPVGGLFNGANTKAIGLDGIFSPHAGVIGKNVISYSISAGPCIAYAQTTIEIEQFISAEMEKQPSPVVCVNSEPFDMNAFVRNRGGIWSGPGMNTGSSMFNPTQANLGPNNVLTYYTNSAGNSSLCPDRSSLQIEVRQMPKASIQTSSLSGCAPLIVSFTSPENAKGSGSWTFDDGETGQGFTTSHIFTRPGKYNIQYKYEDTEAPGCSVIVKQSSPVTVLIKPDADFIFSREEISVADPEVQLLNRSTGIGDNYYLWTVTGQQQQYKEVNPTLTFPKAGNYRITLETTNTNGCKSQVTKLVEVKNDFNVFIPNSFTPNYDGLNDEFKPVFSAYGVDLKTYRMTVYNRWGQLLFETTDHTLGWDGTRMNLKDTNPKQDSYNYQIRFSDLEGRSYLRSGTVTIMP